MDDAEAPSERSGIWICPACGARLVSRNLWHSCGRYSLENLFAKADPGSLELARTYVAVLHTLGDVQVLPQKTRLVCVARVRFSGLEPRKYGFLANFALHRWLDSSRVAKTVDYGPRWRVHYVRVRSEADVDDELIAWLQESHVGVQIDLRGAPEIAAQTDRLDSPP
ncbi:MAG TPA: hypothetical protein VFI46_10955 [Jiangellaceae bacterium]|nr:hypothetical protein [Jiangellaceae bacterium]